MARATKLKKGSVLKGWIVEDELTPGGAAGGGQNWLAVRVGRESFAGYVISNLHAVSERFLITGEPGDWILQRVTATDWKTVNGSPGRRVYRGAGMVLRESATIPPLVEGL
jgi:hypothetical protein